VVAVAAAPRERSVVVKRPTANMVVSCEKRMREKLFEEFEDVVEWLNWTELFSTTLTKSI
jgi:hypothetical protein